MKLLDVFFYEGSIFLLKMALAVLKKYERQILESRDPDHIVPLIKTSMRNESNEEIFEIVF